MNGIFKRICAWFVAVLTTVILGVVMQTQNVLARLEEVGADVALADRLLMTFQDIIGLGSRYIIFVSIALAIAFWPLGLSFGSPNLAVQLFILSLAVLLF